MPEQSLSERLSAAAGELAGLLGELEKILPHRPAGGYRPAGGGKPSGSRALTSWNSQAAMAILAVHAGVRELECNLRYRSARVVRERGGSDANTLAALEAVISLAAGAAEWDQRNAIRKTERWCWQARLALGDAEPLQHLPRLPGQRAPRCPWCNFTTLRMRALAGVVRCVNPACRDSEGRKPVAKVEFGAASGEPLLVWQDDIAGLPVMEDA